MPELSKDTKQFHHIAIDEASALLQLDKYTYSASLRQFYIQNYFAHIMAIFINTMLWLNSPLPLKLSNTIELILELLILQIQAAKRLDCHSDKGKRLAFA